MRIINIRKEQQSINLAEMVSVNSHSWKKSACFNNIVDSVDSVVNYHTVADIVAMVTNEVPIDSGAALQEAQSTSKFIVESVLRLTFLDPVSFLTSAGNEAILGDPTDLKSRPSDITYIRFRCTMHGSFVDARVKNIAELSFHFCLQLPQHTYDEASGDVALVSASPSGYTMGSTNGAVRSLNASFAAADGKAVLNTPTKSNIPSSTGGASPAMTRFLSSQKSSSGTKKGYFGSCDFLNSLDEFRLTFDHYPIMLPNSPNKTSTEMTSKRIVREYGDQCKLEFYAPMLLKLCRTY